MLHRFPHSINNQLLTISRVLRYVFLPAPLTLPHSLPLLLPVLSPVPSPPAIASIRSVCFPCIVSTLPAPRAASSPTHLTFVGLRGKYTHALVLLLRQQALTPEERAGEGEREEDQKRDYVDDRYETTDLNSKVHERAADYIRVE